MVISGHEVVGCLIRTARLTVHRGRRSSDDVPVLLKQLTPSETPAISAGTLQRELELLQAVASPALPQAVGILHDPGGDYLILEDRGFEPLSERLRSGPLPTADALTTAIRVCTALVELHRRDVVHGSLHPAAILVGAQGEAQLVDVPVARRGATDLHTIVAADGAPYMSPEQTGRINREVDYRTDFYSLGALLYEMLLGTPPFQADDPLELVHAHIARSPAPPAGVDPHVPDVLSSIVLRLLAKSPEDRYQSAHGILHDLERCARSWREQGRVEAFALGERDVPDRFQVPQKLYGRDRELAQLLEAFEEACEGRATMLLVAGFAGAGKTALINELCRPMVRQRGCFIAGKFDQVVRNIPYGALLQAFRSLVGQLLTQSEGRLASWRTALAEALGPNAGVLAEIFPDIELILGPQPAPAALDAAEAQNRFRYVLQSFVGTVARLEHPLVVFLDDLQWADPATLNLLQALVTAPDIRHLLLICAFRDNEVDASHPATAAIEALERDGAVLRRVLVPPLALPDVTAFLADVLHAGAADIAPLARLVRDQTDGNPFFVIQSLKALAQERLLEFDHHDARWSFRLDAIRRAGLTADIVELMARKIRRLSPAAQRVLSLAAGIGSRFEWDTLQTVSREPSERTRAALAEAVDAGLVLPLPGPQESGDGAGRLPETYAFLHDRVQQAAYAAVPDDRKAPLHLDIGRLLLARFDGGTPDDRIFEVVNHLTLGRHLIVDRAEQLALGRLCLAAGRRAKTATAYQAAVAYLDVGLELLSEGDWQAEYALMFALQLEAAECHYLAGDFDGAERRFAYILTRATSVLDRAQVHTLRIVSYENQSRWADAVASGREGLALFGLSFPDRPDDTAAALDREVEATRVALGDRDIGSLVDLPVMDDPNVRVVMRILTTLWAPAYISGDQLLARLISAMMVRLSLAHGNAEDSAYGYVTHAITVGPVRRDYAAAYEWGLLALAVNERFGDTKRRAKIHQQFQAHVNLWRRPFATCIPHAREARRSGLETGDFTYAGYGAVTESWSDLLVTRDLERFVADHTPTLALLEKIRMADFRAALTVVLNWARALQGRTSHPLSLSTDDFDEEAFVSTFQTAAPFFLTFVYTAKLHLSLTYGAFGAAADFARRAREVAVAGTIWPVLVSAWGGLAAAALCRRPAPEDRHWQEVVAARDLFAELDVQCPENFRCWHLLLAAEAQRLERRDREAADLYELAIRYARETGQLQHEALAHELCARMWMGLGRDALAAPFMDDARRAYLAWGATVKAAQLEERYPGLLPPRQSGEAGTLRISPAPPIAAPVSLDMATVLKLAHAVAVELELDGLLRTVLQLAIENAGAERGVFVSEHDGRLFVEAEADADRQARRLRPLVPIEQASHVPQSVVRYVRRTGQDLVVGCASDDERFSNDPYVAGRRSKSVLCVPVGRHGRLGGLLYLENHLTANAFGAERIEMMRILAAQAAISLENARLYEDMKEEVARRTMAESALRDALAEVEGLKNRLEAENVYLQEEIRTQHNFNEIIGNSPALIEALDKVERVAPTESTVLILGETGAGKELFARAIHSRSARSGRPLVKVNCGAIPPGLVESELFGHVKGAFTGAIDKRVGRFELAHGGTIFLDEIGELPLDAQVKLLRVLQEQEFEPVGSSRTVRISVRVIAATNRNLDLAVREGKFRADLLYRLNVFPIEIPPLRRRGSDIGLLAGFFIAALSRKLGKPIQGFSATSMERMMRYAWPGNVRELENVVERAAILAKGPILEVEGALASADVVTAPPSSQGLDEVQRLHILSVLKATGGLVEGPRGAAAMLGLHPNTLRSRMKKLGISARS
jgi:predicted ATPase/transcriptional regulator with GAF, ATPase, and Fis domain